MEKSKYFNEDYYLQGTPDVIKYFHRTFEERENIWLAEKKVYSEALGKYDSFISQVAEFIKSLGFKNSYEATCCLSYLIHNGYLSDNMSFSDMPPDQLTEITCKYGINIILGDGCCRNYSAIHQDVFGKLDYVSEQFPCYQGINTFNRAKYARANHIINLIQHEGITYGFDMYNLNNLFHFINPFVLQEISTYRRSNLRYKPYHELENGYSTIEELRKKIERFSHYAEQRAINPFDYEADLKYKTKRKIRGRAGDYRDFHDATKTLKKEIRESVEEANRKFFK